MCVSIPLFKIYSDEDDLEKVGNIIKRGTSWANGPEVNEFEEEISEYIGTKYALTFSSGTAAMHALFMAYDIKNNDEVIIPSFTFISTANTPLFVNAKPVFSDIEENTYGLDPENVKEKITSRTKAIVPVHYGGCPCLIEELKEIAEDYNVLLLEDAAESFGSKVKNKKVGTFGDASMMSFCQNKIISTGEGGSVVTDSKEIYEKLKLIRSHGRLENNDYFSSSENMDYISLGYNFRMSSINAALGIAQIKKVDRIIDLRRNAAEYYSSCFNAISGVVTLKAPANYFNVYQMYPIRVNEEIRDNLINYLSSKGISTKIYFSPVHLTKYYQNLFGYKSETLQITDKVSKQILSLPIYPTISKNEIDYVVQEINNYINST